MYAMQYEITLPADYNMGIIHERVAAKGKMLDKFPGLGLKAYLVRERGVDNSPINQYAPFYLWASIDGMRQFLWGGGGFKSIITSFGRPTVLHWTGVGCMRGVSGAVQPKVATRFTIALPPDSNLELTVETARIEMKRVSDLPGVHSTAVAIDPKTWELIRFTLWEENATDAEDFPGIRYRVLHLSTPHINEIM